MNLSIQDLPERGVCLLVRSWQVPSSRESVSVDSPWNQWLREEVPPLFEAAIRRFCSMAREMEAAAAAQLMNYALAFVPLPGLVSEFFATLAPSCGQRLRRCECVLAADGRFVFPDRAILLDTASHSEPDKDHEKSLEAMIASIGLSFAHHSVLISPVLAKELGVRRVDASLLTEILQDLCTSRWRSVTDVDIDWLTWALCELNRDATLSKQLPDLRKMSFLPLDDDRLGSPDDGPLLELPESVCKQIGRISAVSKAFASLQIIHHQLVHGLAKKQAIAILSRLNVKRLDAAEFVRQYVVSALASPATPASELPHLLGFARSLVLQCRALQKGSLERWLLDAGARICTTKGEVFVLGSPRSPLQLSRDFWPVDEKGRKRRDFVPQPPPSEWKEVHVVLGPDECNDLDGWRAFLEALGIRWFPSIVPVDGANACGDWESPALEALLDELTRLGDQERLRALAEAVKDNWRTLLRAHCVVGSNNPEALYLNPDMAQPTRLLNTLRGRAWLPAARRGSTDDRRLYRPGELWAPKPELRAVLGDDVPYPCIEFAEETVWVFGMLQETSPETVLPLVTGWASQPSFKASPDQMAKLIKLLYAWASADPSLQPKLACIPCIWLPEERIGHSTSSASRPGSFYLPSRCVLQDRSELLDNAQKCSPVAGHVSVSSGLRCLSQLYDASFLHETAQALSGMGVRRTPSVEEYVGMLLSIVKMKADHNQTLSACYSILSVFGEHATWRELHAKSHIGGDSLLQRDDRHAADLSHHTSGTLEEALETMRIALAAALRGQKVLPSADGIFQTLEETFFYVPKTYMHVQKAEYLNWSSPTLQHTVLVELPQHIVVNLPPKAEENLATLFETVLQLRSLERGLQEAINMRALEPPDEPTASHRSVWLYAAAGVMQRFLLTQEQFSTEQCNQTAHNFRTVTLQRVAELSVCRQVVSPVTNGLRWVGPFERGTRAPTGRQLRRPALVEALQAQTEFAPEELQELLQGDQLRVDDYVVVGSTYYRPAASGEVIERAAGVDRVAHLNTFTQSDGESARTLYVTSQVDAEEIAKELFKLLPPNVPVLALLLLVNVLTHVWAWEEEGQPPRDLRDEIFKKGELRWQKQPTLPDGVAEWVSFSAGAGNGDVLHAEADAEAMKKALERERAMLATPNAAAATDLDGSAELALQQLEIAGELDPALASAVLRIRQMMLSRQPACTPGAAGLGLGGRGMGTGETTGGSDGGYMGGMSGAGDMGGVRGMEMRQASDGSIGALGISGASDGPRPVAPELMARAEGSHDQGHHPHPLPPSGETLVSAVASGSTGFMSLSTPTVVHGIEWKTSSANPLCVAALGPLDEVDTTQIGRWGERLVYEELRHVHALAGTQLQVTWVNQDGEAGHPYDVLLVAPDGQVGSYAE